MDTTNAMLTANTNLYGFSTRLQHAEAAAKDDPQAVASVAQEFESVFLAMLLKNMRSTVSEGGMFAGDESDTFGSMFDLFMSQHLASSESLGIAKLVQNNLAQNHQSESSP